MFANEGIPLFDELLKIYRFIYLIPGLLFQIACSYEAFTIQLVIFIQIRGLGGIIYYTYFLHLLLYIMLPYMCL